MTDKMTWINQAQQGNDTTFTMMVETNQKSVYNLCCWMLYEDQAPEDTAQETFHNVYPNVGCNDSARFFATWLFSIADLVEMSDVATPMTYERYNCNWQASYKGFLPTPQTIRSVFPSELPDLENLYMAGHGPRVGGGIPTGVSMGRKEAISICKQEGVKFQEKLA